MTYLILSILASTVIFILFKLFKKFQINTQLAIVVNYIVACITGLSFYEKPISVSEILLTEWFYGAIILGFLFIAIFNVMAMTSQRYGLSVASIATKMSVIIPVIFGIFAYNEGTGILKISGIILALIAVYLASVEPTTNKKQQLKLFLPITLFLGAGIIDTSVKFIESTYLDENGIPIFSATIFCFAAVIGIFMIIFKTVSGNFIFNLKSIIGGSVLGIVNYASIYYLLKALNHETIESSTIFTVNNVGIIMITSLVGLIAFNEKLSLKNWFGIVLAIISIVLVTLI